MLKTYRSWVRLPGRGSQAHGRDKHRYWLPRAARVTRGRLPVFSPVKDIQADEPDDPEQGCLRGSVRPSCVWGLVQLSSCVARTGFCGWRPHHTTNQAVTCANAALTTITQPVKEAIRHSERYPVAARPASAAAPPSMGGPLQRAGWNSRKRLLTGERHHHSGADDAPGRDEGEKEATRLVLALVVVDQGVPARMGFAPLLGARVEHAWPRRKHARGKRVLSLALACMRARTHA